MLDLRRLLSKYNIRWVDRGPNCNINHVNIQCPFCGTADRSQHLGIDETGEGFFCLRNARHHGSIAFLMNKLRIPEYEWKDQKFGRKEKAEPVDKDYSLFQYFESAAENEEARMYLQKRLFSDPERACFKFNLRSFKEGRWVGRLIIPLSLGWTGRAMRDHMEPRYLSHTNGSGMFVHGNEPVALLVEGPLDAMRAATVSDKITVIGKLGKRLSATLFYKLKELQATTIYHIPDEDVNQLELAQDLRLLRSYLPRALVEIVRPPEGYKDLCAAPESVVRDWLYDVQRRTNERTMYRGVAGNMV